MPIGREAVTAVLVVVAIVDDPEPAPVPTDIDKDGGVSEVTAGAATGVAGLNGSIAGVAVTGLATTTATGLPASATIANPRTTNAVTKDRLLLMLIFMVILPSIGTIPLSHNPFQAQ